MSSTLFKKIDYSLSKLIHDIEHGGIGLPDIQRPFVWEAVRVRDLFDSMYKGFPVGYLLFWSNDHLNGTRQIGSEPKQSPVPHLLIVDGQQRLTSLYAVIRGQPVVAKDFTPARIRIAFRPRDGRFEVTDAAISRDPEFIPDISKLWSGEVSRGRFVKQFLARLRQARDVSEDEEDLLTESIDRLYDVQNYPFTAMEISSTVNEEQVSDIFVRVNSKGIALNQADFIMTLLSVFWDEGRAQLEQFCRDCRKPKAAPGCASPFNHFMHPDPDHLLRVCIGLGFKRARLQHVYSILRGKDLETGEFSDERREKQFDVLKAAQAQVINLASWHEFHKVLMRAGFCGRSMITSETGLLYAYVMFLIGKREYHIEPHLLRDVMARWFFAAALTGRYTSASETTMESDLARLRDVTAGQGFVNTLDQMVREMLTEDYWSTALVTRLETASARTPVWYAYLAALNLLEARVLFSEMRVSDLLDPALGSVRSATERHHLFPKEHLRAQGVTEVRQTNQLANYAVVEWSDNIAISDASPQEYFPKYAAMFSAGSLETMMRLHALPAGWEQMEYGDFLAERRRLIAQVIREGFAQLCKNSNEGI